MPVSEPPLIIGLGLGKQERIRRRSEFLAVIKHGARYSTRNFVILVRENDKNSRRLGIVVSKKVGGAVKRNRVKRLVREFFRLHKEQLPEASDIVFVAKSESIHLDYAALCKEMSAFFSDLSAA
ncbi:MAG: ribonuclease P protein component [Deltaproteobacteria bacterium]|nr:ribonuclease P protein component [Deltaproteobacteria bacterium]